MTYTERFHNPCLIRSTKNFIFFLVLFSTRPVVGSERFVTMDKKKADLISSIEKIVRYHGTRLNIPGGTFGLIIDGEVVLKIAEGQRVPEKKTSLNFETLFQIGSIAKTFAATTAIKFHLQNKLQLDHPVEKYLPHRCHGTCDGMTIRHLLSHTSGISATGLNTMIERGDSYESIVTEALKAKRLCKPGRCYQYNNVAFELVREILEKVDNQNYFAILKRELFIPLQMSRLSATFDELIQSDNYFIPHIYLNGRFKEAQHSKAYYRFPGSSVLNASLDDMLKFVAGELGYAPKVISAEALAIAHEPVINAPDAATWLELRKGEYSKYALGHRVVNYQGLKVVFHTGWIKGSKNIVAMFPEEKIGFVLLQNSESSLCLIILDKIARMVLQRRNAVSAPHAVEREQAL